MKVLIKMRKVVGFTIAFPFLLDAGPDKFGAGRDRSTGTTPNINENESKKDSKEATMALGAQCGQYVSQFEATETILGRV